jgi:predicted nuclease of predicted toxin-antitoxin system
MRPILCLDECVDRRLIRELSRKYNIVIPKTGLSDYEIRDLASVIDAYILTYDRGFPDYAKLIYARSYYDARQKVKSKI